jgi:PAS domain S-box-containing protein
MSSSSKRTVVELEELRNRLREAEETLDAIRSGEVDSLIVTGPHGDQVFSLKGAEQPYRVFVEQMLEGAVTLNEDGTVLYCNRRFAEMVQSRLEKVIGSKVQAFVRAADQEELGEILRSPESRKARFVLSGSDNTLTPTQLAFSRLPMDEEGVNAICVVVTDLTEQEEKQELATALENLRSAQEQLQRQNEELLRARAAAEAASDAKDAFLAALSHELRTPLTPVLMAVESLESDHALPDAARRELAVLRRNVELEARLIDDLLDITRIVRGKVELKPDVVEVHAVLGAAVDICRADLVGKELRLIEDLQATETHVSGDAVRLQQILWNLIRNAVKFTPAGGQITLRSHSGGGRLQIAVVDTGIGIENGAIGKIFTPFEQADRFITQQFGGLGLGLTISKRLVELHNGTLVAQSEGRDKGATFTLSLPTVPAPALNQDGIAGARATAAAVPVDADAPPKLKILLVEDHDDTRRSMARLLARRHTVRDVNSVATALRAAGTDGPFDLVISDVGLPDGSGLDLMRQLREQHGLQGICLSGFGMEEDIARSAEAGFCHHLTKPVDLHRLEAVIRQMSPASAVSSAPAAGK